MELSDALRSTGAVRDFTDAPVPDDVLYRMLWKRLAARTNWAADDSLPGGRPGTAAFAKDLFEGKRLYLALVGPFDDPTRFETLLAA